MWYDRNTYDTNSVTREAFLATRRCRVFAPQARPFVASPQHPRQQLFQAAGMAWSGSTMDGMTSYHVICRHSVWHRIRPHGMVAYGVRQGGSFSVQGRDLRCRQNRRGGVTPIGLFCWCNIGKRIKIGSAKSESENRQEGQSPKPPLRPRKSVGQQAGTRAQVGFGVRWDSLCAG